MAVRKKKSARRKKAAKKTPAQRKKSAARKTSKRGSKSPDSDLVYSDIRRMMHASISKRLS